MMDYSFTVSLARIVTRWRALIGQCIAFAVKQKWSLMNVKSQK